LTPRRTSTWSSATVPRDQAQVDWAHFGKLRVGRAAPPLWAFVVVLSYSRRICLRFLPGASMTFFARGYVEAFDAFGGVPRVLPYDNLKSTVVERRGEPTSTSRPCRGAAIGAPGHRRPRGRCDRTPSSGPVA
jgi:transposase